MNIQRQITTAPSHQVCIALVESVTQDQFGLCEDSGDTYTCHDHPSDLSYIILARHGNEDYVYHLLNGYCDAPAGIQLMDGQHFNPYMLGGAIAMQAPLYSEVGLHFEHQNLLSLYACSL